MAIKSLASEFKVPIISAGAADAIGIPADPWLFKVAPAVKDFMTVLAQYAKDNGYTRIAMLNGTDAFGQAEIAAMRQLAPKMGLELVAAETYSASRTRISTRSSRASAPPTRQFSTAASLAARDPVLQAIQAARTQQPSWSWASPS